MYNLENKELNILNNMPYNKNLKPNFEEIKYCLIWEDEIKEGISRETREFLNDLLIYRGLLHRNIPKDNWIVDVEYFNNIWEYAKDKIPNWNGFKRIKLNELEKAFLLDCTKEYYIE